MGCNIVDYNKFTLWGKRLQAGFNFSNLRIKNKQKMVLFSSQILKFEVVFLKNDIDFENI